MPHFYGILCDKKSAITIFGKKTQISNNSSWSLANRCNASCIVILLYFPISYGASSLTILYCMNIILGLFKIFYLIDLTIGKQL